MSLLCIPKVGAPSNSGKSPLENKTGNPEAIPLTGFFIVPCFRGCSDPRFVKCGSSDTSATVRTGPQGTSDASNFFIASLHQSLL